MRTEGLQLDLPLELKQPGAVGWGDMPCCRCWGEATTKLLTEQSLINRTNSAGLHSDLHPVHEAFLMLSQLSKAWWWVSQKSAISRDSARGKMVKLRVVFKKTARSLQVITGLRKMRKECTCGTWHRGGFTKKLTMLKFQGCLLAPDPYKPWRSPTKAIKECYKFMEH